MSSFFRYSSFIVHKTCVNITEWDGLFVHIACQAGSTQLGWNLSKHCSRKLHLHNSRKPQHLHNKMEDCLHFTLHKVSLHYLSLIWNNIVIFNVEQYIPTIAHVCKPSNRILDKMILEIYFGNFWKHSFQNIEKNIFQKRCV